MISTCRLDVVAERNPTPQVASAQFARMLLVLAVCILSCGCHGVWRDARRTLIFEPLKYSGQWDKRHSKKRFRAFANLELEAIEPKEGFARDYERGFKEGFVDYVLFGGTGEPPPLPPRDYWGLRAKMENHPLAAEEWFTGFRDGASVARQRRYRDMITVPSSYRAAPPFVSFEPVEAPLPEYFFDAQQ